MKKLISIILFTICALTLFAGVKVDDQRSFRISKNLSIFNSIFREMDLYYVDTLSYDKMMKSTIDNMLQKLDPYTVYIPEEETDDLKFMTTGEYAGIGAMIMKRENEVYISELYEGKPAQKNGVMAGDMIVEINDKKMTDLSVNEVSALLKGSPNTIIKLKLKRFGEKSTRQIQFPREKIQINPISYSAVVGDKVGYLLLNDFTDRAAQELKIELSKLITQHQINSLVLDLRNNGGGLVDEAVKILGYFLPKGTEVVTTKGKNEQSNRTYKTPTEPIFPNLKLVVLTNSSSASASEILAGSLQDLDKAIIIGERTYGKGLVQSIHSLNYDGHIKVTTAKYYIPSGRCIQAIDYSHRNEDGSVGHIADSLTHVFFTKNGRKVRDGGGIVPDSVTKSDRKLNIAYYIYAQNLYFDFANQYVQKHTSISPPKDFKLSDADYQAFSEYLLEKKFSYTSQTEKEYAELYNTSKVEGLDTLAAAEFTALKAKLVPNIPKSLADNKADISELLSAEIIKRYYYQKGLIEFSLRSDKDLKVALNILQSELKFDKMLKKKSLMEMKCKY